MTHQLGKASAGGPVVVGKPVGLYEGELDIDDSELGGAAITVTLG